MIPTKVLFRCVPLTSSGKAAAGIFIALVLVLIAWVPGTAYGQDGFYVIPSISLIEGHDDNLFFSIEDEQAGLFTRVSPALEAGYDTETLFIGSRYSFDAEAYDKYPELDSSMVRRFADARIEFLPNSRMTFSTDASYTLTNTPLDLSPTGSVIVPGLLVGRTDARRNNLNPEFEYRFTNTTTGLVAYTLTKDKLFGSVESEIQELELAGETALSAENTISYGYAHRDYQFDVPAASVTAADQNSQYAWVGLEHQLGPRTVVSGKLGPRYYDETVKPLFLATLEHAYLNGEVALGFERNETTLLGEVGRVENKTVSATLVHRFGSKFEMQLMPGYSDVSQDGFEVQIYRVGIFLRYRVNDAVSLTTSYDLSHQQVDFEDGSESSVERNVVMLGLTLTYPRRNRAELR